MKAAIYYGMGDVQVVDMPYPKPGPGDVVLKVVKCGICGSDSVEYNVMKTDIIHSGSHFGHECAGIIAEVGSEVKGITEGMRVTVYPITATRMGMMGGAMVGGFSQYTLIEDAALGYNIFPLPDALSFEDGALVEPFAVGLHSIYLVDPQPKDRILVVGAGPIGLSALAALKTLGVESVVVCDISELRLQKAKELGASAVHNVREAPLECFLEKFYGESYNPFMGLVNVIIDAAGAPSMLEVIMNIATTGARISIPAVYHQPMTINPVMLLSKSLTIKGSLCYVYDEFNQVMEFVASGKADLKPMITNHYPLDEINTALKLASKADEAVKVMIDIPA